MACRLWSFSDSHLSRGRLLAVVDPLQQGVLRHCEKQHRKIEFISWELFCK